MKRELRKHGNRINYRDKDLSGISYLVDPGGHEKRKHPSLGWVFEGAKNRVYKKRVESTLAYAKDQINVG